MPSVTAARARSTLPYRSANRAARKASWPSGRPVAQDGREAGAALFEHPAAVDDDGLGAVGGAQQTGDRKGRTGLVEQCELDVQYDSAGAREHGGGRGVRPDAAAGPHRQVGRYGAEYALEQHEGGVFAAGAAGLLAAQNEPGDTVGRGPDGLVGTADLGEHGGVRGGGAGGGPDLGDGPGRVGGEEHGARSGGGRVRGAPRSGVRRGPQLFGAQCTVGGDPHAVAAGRPLPQEGQGLAGGARARAEVEDTGPTGPADGGDEAGVRCTQRADADNGVRHGGRLLCAIEGVCDRDERIRRTPRALELMTRQILMGSQLSGCTPDTDR